MIQEKIVRGTGTTQSERQLAELAEKTFLNLWSHSNVYNDNKQNGKGDGKELCDLLVVCGDDIIIFSDKDISWSRTLNPELAWSRWYRRAIKESVKQICGAERWLRKFPQRIFLDPKCTKRFPIELISLANKRIHGIVIAKGASQACKDFYGDSSGTFPILSSIKGDEHIPNNSFNFPPFATGDVNPDSFFIHVFDSETIELLMKELDTISDFTEYLVKRESFLRSEYSVVATGEEDLMAFYLQNIILYGSPSFISSDFKTDSNTLIQIPSGEFEALINRPEYIAKKEADVISYGWDYLINLFTTNVLGGTQVSVFGELPEPSLAEKALKFLALESRLHRRLLASSLMDALEKAKELKPPRFSRVALHQTKNIAYIFLIFAYSSDMESKFNYEKYRKIRASLLQTYCLSVLFEHRDIKTAIGIAFDAAKEVTGRQGSSEEIMAIEVSEWTDELEKQLVQDRENFGILKPDRKYYNMSTDEYPRSK